MRYDYYLKTITFSFQNLFSITSLSPSNTHPLRSDSSGLLTILICQNLFLLPLNWILIRNILINYLLIETYHYLRG